MLIYAITLMLAMMLLVATPLFSCCCYFLSFRAMPLIAVTITDAFAIFDFRFRRCRFRHAAAFSLMPPLMPPCRFDVSPRHYYFD